MHIWAHGTLAHYVVFETEAAYGHYLHAHYLQLGLPRLLAGKSATLSRQPYCCMNQQHWTSPFDHKLYSKH